MSHFNVLVVTDEYPNDEVLRKALQPYHEFECTGEEDEYVVEVDITAEARDEYNTSTERMYEYIDGTRISAYDDRFYREPTEEESQKIGKFGGSGWTNEISYTSKDWNDGKGYRTKVHFFPEGWKEAKVPVKEVKNFPLFVEDYYGYHVGEKEKFGWCEFVDGNYKVVKYTNPNAKWDWWTIGGRYSNLLRTKAGSKCDYAKVEALSLNRMFKANVKERADYVDTILEGCGWPPSTGEEALVKLTEGVRQVQKAKKLWDDLPEPRPRGAEYQNWMFGLDFVDDNGRAYQKSRDWDNWINPKEGQTVENWINDAPALTFFAAVVNGEWVEKGRMGWWATVSDEKDDWLYIQNKIVSSLKPDQYVTIVDCHI